MGVLPEYRGHGLGERLLRATMKDALDKGVERLELEVFASNWPAIGLYRKLGFEEEGRKRSARKIDGKSEDILLMAKLAK